MSAKVVQGCDVTCRQIDDMDVVAHPGAIGGGVVVAPDIEKFAFADGQVLAGARPTAPG